MKISRLKPLLRAWVVGETILKRNLLIFMVCCAVKACRSLLPFSWYAGPALRKPDNFDFFFGKFSPTGIVSFFG